jgi:hypothetical protein
MNLVGLPADIIRRARRQIYQDNLQYPAHLIPVPQAQWPEWKFGSKAKPVGVWRSKDYLVMIFSEDAHIRLSICRTMVASDGHYLEIDGWETMQQLKKECGFGESDAVEVYPKEKDIVNVAKMRHLWILNPDDNLKFIWRNL